MDQTSTRITVIMGIYNCASTLVEALDSLYQQTYKGFKIVLCDDGSTDETYQVAQMYAEQKDNIILIRNQENMKLAATLNHCIEYADTEYVARMDADDVSLPDRFQEEIDFLDSHPEFALVSCPMIYFDESGDWGIGKAIPFPKKEDFNQGTPFCHAPAMMRTAILKEIGGYTACKLTERAQDYHLWSKFYLAGYYGHNLSTPLYKMRNGREAFARRRPVDRFRTFLLKVQVKRALKLRFPILSSAPELFKALVPSSIARVITKKISRYSTNN